MTLNLMNMSAKELETLFIEWERPAFRAKQVREWLLKGVHPNDMGNIPKELRARLCSLPWGGARIEKAYRSTKDDTVKYLFRLDDGQLVEGVLMRYHHGNTICLSTQVGCRMGCAFCASTLHGRVRNIEHGEMLGMLGAVEQIERPASRGGRGVTNIVLMGSGEPLDNYEHVVTFLRRVTDPGGLNISPRNISLSTCGLVPEMLRFMREAPHVVVCVSLHAHSDAVRDTLVPINKHYPIAELIAAAKEYANFTGRRVIFEYALIEGVNASEQDAQALSRLLRGVNCHVNLIPLNPVEESTLRGVTKEHAARFKQWLTSLHISATVRREMGTDIAGACGQLRQRELDGGL